MFVHKEAGSITFTQSSYSVTAAVILCSAVDLYRSVTNFKFHLKKGKLDDEEHGSYI